MSRLSDFPITRRWPPAHPDRIQLYSLATPNGVKASIMLEETGLAYEPHLVDITKEESHTPEFLSLNPNNKTPVIVDDEGPNGPGFVLWETGAILLYLAEKTGRFLPADPVKRAICWQWLMFQVSGVGPMFGQVHHFLAVENEQDRRYGLERYSKETRRLYGVADRRLAEVEFFAASGAIGSFNASFRLVGDTAGGGLAVK